MTPRTSHRPQASASGRACRHPARAARAALSGTGGRLAAWAVCCLTLAACDDRAGVSAERPPNVLLVCIDTARADHLGCYGYQQRPTTPTLDRLARDGLVFTQAGAASGWTKPSVPSFLTGTPPAIHGVYEGSARRGGAITTDLLGEQATTLAEAFAEAGYATAAFVRNAQLRKGLGFEQGFDLYQDQAGDAARICDAARHWLADREDDRPWFLYLHILDVHWPYDIPDQAATRFAEHQTLALVRGDDWRARRDAINHGEITLDAHQRDQLLALYDGALRYVDDQLGLLLSDMDAGARGLPPVVAVVSDHGEEFLEHGRLGHGNGLWDDLTHAVFLLHGPGVPARRVDTPVQLPDLHPTLLAAAGLSAGRDAALWSVDRLARPDQPGPVFAEHKGADDYLQSLRVGNLKLVRRFSLPDAQLVTSQLEYVRRGGRWEAELRETSPRRLASQLKPRTESERDPVELKGRLVLSEQGASLAGVPLSWSDDLSLGGSLSRSEDLVPGWPMKLEGHMEKESFRVTHAKGYSVDARLDTEIRGPVTRVIDAPDGTAIVFLGGLAVTVDDRTVFKNLPDDDLHPLLSRDQVALLLEWGGDRAVDAGFQLETRLYDLDRDPGEQQPVLELVGATVGAAEPLAAMVSRLDTLGRRLAADRHWSARPGQTLDQEDLAALRALGYVR